MKPLSESLEELAGRVKVLEDSATATFEAAADALLADARGYGSNDFKIPLARRTLIASLRDLTGR